MAQSTQTLDVILGEAQEKNQILASKSFSWGEIRRGDCTIDAGATFTLYSDGSSNWKCDISSTDSGDEWDGFFRVENAGGVVLAEVGNYHFNISDSNTKKRWNESRGPNGTLAGAFAEAARMSFFCDC